MFLQEDSVNRLTILKKRLVARDNRSMSSTKEMRNIPIYKDRIRIRIVMVFGEMRVI